MGARLLHHPPPTVASPPESNRGGLRSFEPIDNVLLRYLAFSKELASVPALDLILASSRMCVYCGVGERSKKPDGEGLFRCSNCGATWYRDSEFGVILRGEIDRATKKSNTETRIVAIVDRWRAVRPLIEPVPSGCSNEQWQYTLLCWSALLDQNVGTFLNVARLLRAFRPELPNSVFEISKAVGYGRETVRRRIEIERHGGFIVSAETELLGASEAAELLGLPPPNGRRQALRYMERNLVEGVIDVGASDRRRLKAPRWAWLRFKASRSADGRNGQNGHDGQNGHCSATTVQ